MNTETLIGEALKQTPLAAVLFWMVWTGNKKIDKKDEQIEKNSDKLQVLIENNTVALTNMTNTVKEQSEVGKTLNDRILAVLTRHNGK